LVAVLHVKKAAHCLVLRNRKSGYAGFPVEVGGVVELHAAFLEESRTRGPVWCCVTGNPDTPDFL
jgi:hypothetical protein